MSSTTQNNSSIDDTDNEGSLYESVINDKDCTDVSFVSELESIDSQSDNSDIGINNYDQNTESFDLNNSSIHTSSTTSHNDANLSISHDYAFTGLNYDNKFNACSIPKRKRISSTTSDITASSSACASTLLHSTPKTGSINSITRTIFKTPLVSSRSKARSTARFRKSYGMQLKDRQYNQ
ncbi:unnamed protein product [Rotaria magnacalcarata]|uniref:Uncharacterized protein n=1 Tax=Rotaria magnacalcarata TaxID=392030 RepID=A0A816ZVH1_9BILA|nr:unnamed protein product [Rotaria magnacalcarata]CAF2228105.1 unnamed protein product [Rotaria magnacalcarata]CAF3942953.1 unnamed protein product [Rotaria magnacalcarata]CAF4154229.1 unnamed protein product [Rotaria magnacalcarata]